MRAAFLLLVLLSASVYSQSILQGVIIDTNTKQPLESANVFVANSTYKTITNSQGVFFLMIPEGTYNVVVSFVGYASTSVNSTAFTNLSKRYTIGLSAEVEQLRPVTIMSAKSRARYLDIFKETLIGTSKNGKKSTILNLDEVNVEFDAETRILDVSAFEPLVIINPELNYRLTFVLSHFRLDFHTGTSNYSGYPLFEDLNPITEKNRKKVLKNRLRAYHGSVMHFMRSVYDDTFVEEGFTVGTFSVRPNPAYPGIDSVRAMTAFARKTRNFAMISHIPARELFTYGNPNLTVGDFTMEDSGRKLMHFSDFLQVTYKNESEELEYRTRNHRHDSGRQVSQLRRLGDSVEIFPNGNYAPASDLLLHGYMGWEKLADVLPFDYVESHP